MKRVPDLDWPHNLFAGDMADQLMIEHQENGFWEEGDCLTNLGSLELLIPVICNRRAITN